MKKFYCLIMSLLSFAFLVIYQSEYKNTKEYDIDYVLLIDLVSDYEKPNKKEEVLETFSGIVTAYTSNCKGCIGITASGENVKNNIYYNDKEYGKIRIVAADKKYKFGTIIRFTNIKNYQSFLAIVLDRGSQIGLNKRSQFDLLVKKNSEANEFGVKKNVKFEVLRLGF